MSGYNPQDQSEPASAPPRSKVVIIFLGIIAAACVLQFIFMVTRLANLSSFPPEQWGVVQFSTNMQVLVSLIGLICLYGTWNRDRKLTLGFYGLALANIALSLYSDQPLIAATSVVAMLLHLIALRYH